MTAKLNNPLTPLGFWLIIVVFVYLGLTFLAGLEDTLGPYIAPIIFACSLFALVWLFFQVRTGEISMVSQNGILHKYSRKREPIMFFIVCAFIGLIALTLVIALGSDIFFGCEGSLINPC